VLKATYTKYLLQFKAPAGTSRGILHEKETWFIKIWDDGNPSQYGIGECAIFRGLSMDDHPDYEQTLEGFCKNINYNVLENDRLQKWPSIRFGIESALCDLSKGGNRILFPSKFTEGNTGIPINGLIWMGPDDFVKQQITTKLNAGFRCIKIKVGAAQLSDELDLLKDIRKEFAPGDLEIRLDANGAFPHNKVFEILEQFARFEIHSIEQPIKAGNPEFHAQVCKVSPIPVALDEELIGKTSQQEKHELLKTIKPAYIIIKPALTGGFKASLEWIAEARSLHIGWWVTSALESNVGLNAIAQWTYSLDTKMTQGLGTGSLFFNNIPSPLLVNKQAIYYSKDVPWDLSNIHFDER
jgi:o-succinylbenzoate synthase